MPDLDQKIKRPPLGLVPQFIRLEHREKEINEAIERYSNADYEIPLEWYTERTEIAEKLNEINAPKKG